MDDELPKTIRPTSHPSNLIHNATIAVQSAKKSARHFKSGAATSTGPAAHSARQEQNLAHLLVCV